MSELLEASPITEMGTVVCRDGLIEPPVGKSITIDTTNEDISAIISYDKGKWNFQLIYNGEPRFQTIPSKEPITEAKDSRDNKIIKQLSRLGVGKDEGENLLDEIVTEAIHRKAELFYLMSEDSENENDADCHVCEDESHFTDVDRQRAIATAQNILLTKDPLMFALDVIQTIHTGDKNNIKILLIAIANQSCLNSNGLQATFNGDKGSGKTHLVSSTVHVMPQEYVYVGKLSDKAIYRMLYLLDGSIIFSDDTHLSEALEEIMKEAMSKFQKQISYTVVLNDEAKVFNGPKRMMMLLTSVENRNSDELRDRMFMLTPENSTQQHDNVWDYTNESLKTGESRLVVVDEKILVCREMFRIIKQQTFNVIIPEEIADNAVCTDKSKYRAINKFWDMVKGFTILNFAQREKDDRGYLIATKDDFYNAKELFETQMTNIMSSLDDKERAIMNALVCVHDNSGLSISGIAQKADIPYGTVRDRLKGHGEIKGLLDRISDIKVVTKEGSKTELFRCENVMKFSNEFIYLKGERKDGYSMSNHPSW
ncbi:hypothetical protein SAMN04488589_0623 [Methanolobus vulcani]|uniref:Uncharacterized protein n=1 Tax=Methanolobus vulcani TaxID=38026 RepID=A0A7Z7AUY5_9EURY|nr:hypothetical protein [Methanolobus vulcani]SDF47185.1 hypothetical protein SAMN04488589_0623 [Methanolobus vulcani]